MIQSVLQRNTIWVHRGKLIFTLIIGSAALVLVTLYIYGIQTALKGIYAPIGLFICYILVYDTSDSNSQTHFSDKHIERSLLKIYYIVFFLLIVMLALSIIGGHILLIGVGLLFIISIKQYSEYSNVAGLFQIIPIFILPGIYLSVQTGFYYGNLDLFFHVVQVDNLLRYGGISAINELYRPFPNLHLLAMIHSLVVNVRPKYGIYFPGLITYSSLLLLIYSITSTVLSIKHGYAIMIALAASTSFSFYAVYFFPQSLAFSAIMIVVYTFWKLSSTKDIRFILMISIFMLQLVFTHHLTVVLMAPLMMFVAIYYVRDRDHKLVGSTLLSGFLLLLLYYWVTYSKFLGAFGSAIAGVYQEGLTGQRSSAQIYAWGREALPGIPFQEIFMNNMYYASLVSVYVSGVFYLFYDKKHHSLAPLLLIGVFSSVVIFKTPLSLKGLVRLRLVLLPFFAIILSIGVYNILESLKYNNWTTYIGVFLLTILIISNPIIMNPHIFTSQDHSEWNSAYSTEQLSSTKATGQFINKYSSGSKAASSVTTRFLVNRFTDQSLASIKPTEEGLMTKKSLIVFESRWTNSMIRVESDGRLTGSLDSAYMSKQWYNRSIMDNHIIYDSGSSGISYNTESKGFNPHHN